MDIPVFHDDQHGTAIVAAAGLINACHLTGRDLRETKLVVNGAGAAPLFQWLKREKPGLLGTGLVKWNFTKFLVARDGTVAGRFPPAAKPAALAGAVEAALAQAA